MSGRFEVRPQELHDQAGWVPWDLRKDRAASGWSPSRARVEAWVRRENGGTSAVEEAPGVDTEGPADRREVVEVRRGEGELPAADGPPVDAAELGELLLTHPPLPA